MPRRLKLSRLQALAAEVSAQEKKPSFICIYRPSYGARLFGRAQNGDVDAQFQYGRLCFEGRAAESHTSHYGKDGKDGKDVFCSYTPAEPRSYPAAVEWLQKAADQGHAEARQLLEVVKLHVKDGVH